MPCNERAGGVVRRLVPAVNYDGNAAQIADNLPGNLLDYASRLPIALNGEGHTGKPRNAPASERLHRMNRAYKCTSTAKRSQHAATQRAAGV